jgi:hypothetical protein
LEFLVVDVPSESFPEHLSTESLLGFWSQLARTGRQFQKLTNTHAAEEVMKEPLDQYLFYFVCFYSLKDWLKSYTPQAHILWEQRFNGTIEWAICRDISNRFKHLRVSKPSLASPFTLLREYCTGDRYKMIVVHDAGTASLYDISKHLQDELGAFVCDAVKLLPPTNRNI